MAGRVGERVTTKRTKSKHANIFAPCFASPRRPSAAYVKKRWRFCSTQCSLPPLKMRSTSSVYCMWCSDPSKTPRIALKA